MSRLGCRCGYIMSSTDSPSPCLLRAYYETEISDAVRYNPALRWMDFEMDWDETRECQKRYMQRPEQVEYWFCPQCKRVYEVSNIRQRWIRVYRRTETMPQRTQEEWKTIFVFPETEIDPYTEKDIDILVSDMVYRVPHPYFFRCSPDETIIEARDSKTGFFAFAYELEDQWQPHSAEN